MRYSHIKTQDIVVMYQQQRLSTGRIAKATGMSANAVWKRLQSAGVCTAKFNPHNPGEPCGTRFTVRCSFCGASFQRTRGLIRGRMDLYCNEEHYFADLENPNFTEWRHGKRLGRAVVSRYFRLRPGNIVHHEDANERNNNPRNLIVFIDQADHMSWHRGNKAKIQPLWDGRTAELVPIK